MNWLAFGIICGALMAAWLAFEMWRAPLEDFDNNLADDADLDTIRDELDRQEMKPRKVRAI